MLSKFSVYFDHLLFALFCVGSVLLLVMTFMIGADVFTRNLGWASLSWTNEISEMLLSWMTLLGAPWLLRRGQHIRVDVLLQVLPARLGWWCEWIADVMGFVCCIVLAVYGWRVTHASYLEQNTITKTLETPEWWMTTPWLICFVLMSIEFVFRMNRLRLAERRPRHDAVSAS